MIDLEAIAAQLNAWLELDTFAIEALLGIRVWCSKKLADSSVYVHPVGDGDRICYQLGVLGFLNGLFAEATGKVLVTVYNDGRLKCFDVRPKPGSDKEPEDG